MLTAKFLLRFSYKCIDFCLLLLLLWTVVYPQNIQTNILRLLFFSATHEDDNVLFVNFLFCFFIWSRMQPFIRFGVQQGEQNVRTTCVFALLVLSFTKTITTQNFKGKLMIPKKQPEFIIWHPHRHTEEHSLFVQSKDIDYNTLGTYNYFSKYAHDTNAFCWLFIVFIFLQIVRISFTRPSSRCFRSCCYTLFFVSFVAEKNARALSNLSPVVLYPVVCYQNSMRVEKNAIKISKDRRANDIKKKHDKYKITHCITSRHAVKLNTTIIYIVNCILFWDVLLSFMWYVSAWSRFAHIGAIAPCA